MRILFDQGTPAPLRRWLSAHEVSTAYEQGWATATNGDLIRLAEQKGCELLITTDTNLRFQQNLQTPSIAILVISTTSWPRIQAAAEQVLDVVSELSAGEYCELRIP
ncbi:MAG: DUF5615 family PIN-like protein [Cyanobacteriota bacterium]|nr:DUF5615 family PIN-like protein [Cyanobacteriota bacterium]